jgi:hypothetical protein
LIFVAARPVGVMGFRRVGFMGFSWGQALRDPHEFSK